MTTENVPAPISKQHAGLDYRIAFQANDSNVYLDIDKLGLHNHKVHTDCLANAWDQLEQEGDRAAFTIIDLYNAAPKGLL